jgi:hypothetical protein
MGEHTVQVGELIATQGRLSSSHGLFGQLDFETIHFVWDTAIFVSLAVLLFKYGSRNAWLWVAFGFAAVHEVEHVYLYWLYNIHPRFYAAGGFEGILGSGGVIGSPLARPYLHFGYNLLVTVAMALAVWDEARRVRLASRNAPATPRLERGRARVLVGSIPFLPWSSLAHAVNQDSASHSYDSGAFICGTLG